MTRIQMRIKIPEKYKENERRGLCKVCGKTKEEFEKLRRVYCSEKCARRYQKCFMSWVEFRKKIIKKTPYCKECGSKNLLEVDHIIPVAITGIVFDEKNVQVLCKKHHQQKTKKDLRKIKNHRNNQQELN